MKAATTRKVNQGKKSGNQTHQLAYQKYSCTAQSRAMGRRRRYGDHSPQKKKTSIQNSVESVENGYPVLDFNKTIINVTTELSNTHKTNLKKKSLRNSWRRYQTWSTRMYKMHSTNFK
jgi:hypothetical protein